MNMDILVIKLEEINTKTYELENSFFVLYDNIQHKFILKGKKRDVDNIIAYTYSFDCWSINALIDFILYVTSKTSVINEILYNYNGLQPDLNNLEYSFLYNLEKADYEISRHNCQKISQKNLQKLFGVLQNVFNLHY